MNNQTSNIIIGHGKCSKKQGDVSERHAVSRGEVGALLGWEDMTKEVDYGLRAPELF